jgi:hypothetical protein
MDNSIKFIIQLLGSPENSIQDDQIHSMVTSKINSLMLDIYEIKKNILDDQCKNEYLNKFKYLLIVTKIYEELFKKNIDIDKLIKDYTDNSLQQNNSINDADNNDDNDDNDTDNDDSDNQCDASSEEEEEEKIDQELYINFLDMSFERLSKLSVSNNVEVKRKE